MLFGAAVAAGLWTATLNQLSHTDLVSQLLAAGVRIYEYRPTTIHAKTFVVDGAWSSVGTMNFDNRSLAYNDEVALVALDGGVGAIMESRFLEDLGFADEIRLDAFRRRSRIQRVLERAANVLAGLL